MIIELGVLSSDSMPNTHNPLLSLLYASMNSWSDVLLIHFDEEHTQIISMANSSSVFTPPIQSAWKRIPINNQNSLTCIISHLGASLHHPDSSPSACFYPSTWRSTRGSILGPVCRILPCSDPSPWSGGCPRLRNDYQARSPLLRQHTKYA